MRFNTYCNKFSILDLAAELMSHAQVGFQCLSILDKLAERSLDAFGLRFVFEGGLGHAIWSQSCYNLTVLGVRVDLTLYAHL